MTLSDQGVEALAELARTAVLPQSLHDTPEGTSPDLVTRLTPPGWERDDVDLRVLLEANAAQPSRKRGTVTLRTPQSVSAYVNAHGEPTRAAIYAGDVTTLKVVGLLNGHVQRASTTEIEQKDGSGQVVASYKVPPAVGSASEASGDPGWGDHVAVLQLVRTPEWIAWCENDGTEMGQEAMALFLEDHVLECIEPTASEMSDIARTMDVKKDAQYHGGIRDASGQVNFRYDETIEGRAGQSGDLAIPERIKLSIVPFYGADPWVVWARFRFRLNSGHMKLSYKLERPDIVLLSAFDETIKAVEAATGLIAFQGTPPSGFGPKS